MPSDLCREFERRSRQTPDLDQLLACADLARHAAECETCARQLRDTRHLQVALPQWRAEVPAVDLADAVLACWHDEQPAVATAQAVHPAPGPALRVPATTPDSHAVPHPHTPGSRRGGVLVTAALALLFSALVIAPGRRAPEHSTKTPPQPLAVTDTASPVAASPAERASPAGTASPGNAAPLAAIAPREVPIDRLVWNAGSAWTGLTTAAVGEVTASALSAAGSPPQDHQRQPGVSPLSLLDETIGPMQQDLTEAVYFLMEVLPTGNGSRT